MKKILLTGGSGTLGKEIVKIHKSYGINLEAPSSKQMNTGIM